MGTEEKIQKLIAELGKEVWNLACEKCYRVEAADITDIVDILQIDDSVTSCAMNEGEFTNYEEA